LCVLFFIEIASRRVYLAGCTAHPDGEWVTQQARYVAWTLSERADPVRFLIRDHDRKFTSRFDVVVEAQGIKVARLLDYPRTGIIAWCDVSLLRTRSRCIGSGPPSATS